MPRRTPPIRYTLPLLFLLIVLPTLSACTPEGFPQFSDLPNILALGTANTATPAGTPTTEIDPATQTNVIPQDSLSPGDASTLPATPAPTSTPMPTPTQTPTPEPTAPPTGLVLSADYLETVSLATIRNLSVGFYGANAPTPRYPINIYRLSILTRNELNELVDLQADIFVPQVPEAASVPVLGYAPGTTGISNECAPSLEFELERPWGSYRSYLISLAAQGYISILPDGQNFDDPSKPHEYFIADLEAYTLLDSVRGVYNFLADPEVDENAEPMDDIFFAGYSNGGHAAFAAKDFAPTYAPELNIRGIISHGATTNVARLMEDAAIFSPYIIYVYRHYYGEEVVTPEMLFTQAVIDGFDQIVPDFCVDELSQRYVSSPPAMYNPQFLSALREERIGEVYPILGAVLDANYAGTFGGFDIPVAFFQGTGDAVVTPVSQRRFAQDLCERGQPVTYVSYPAVNHAGIRRFSFDDTFAWMESILAGETPENNCDELGP